MIDLAALPSRSRVLWIGAHPDDELFVAALLGCWRETREAQTHFIVATRGERGPCYRPEGCEPDLATVREEEMRAAAAGFGGEVEFLDCRDGSAPQPDQVLHHWMNESPELAIRLREAVDRFAPDVILTFDPDHGSTDHADHRAAGMLVLQVVGASKVWLTQTRVHWSGNPLRISSRSDHAQRFEVAPWWDYLLRDLECHRSQMRRDTIRAFAEVAPVERNVFLKKA